MILRPNENLDDLEYQGLRIIQREGMYHFTSDSVLLANLVKVRRGDKVLDIGTGSGIIAILIAAKTQAKKVTGIDIQEVMVEMATRSVEYNHLENKVEILQLDVLDATDKLGYDVFDVIVCNPPYSKVEVGVMSDNEHINICKREVTITLQGLIDNASKMLRYGGKFYIIHKATRLNEIMCLMTKYNITPKNLTIIVPRKNNEADTIIIEGKKGANEGMSVKSFLVYNDDNSYTEEIKKLYNKE